MTGQLVACPDSVSGWHDWIREAAPSGVTLQREIAEAPNPERARVLMVTTCRRCGAVLGALP